VPANAVTPVTELQPSTFNLPSFTPSLLHSFTPSLLHSFTPSLLAQSEALH
jgi:hypothetical protein